MFSPKKKSLAPFSIAKAYIENNNTQKFNIMLSKNPDLLKQKSVEGNQTLLMFACKAKNLEAVKSILSYKPTKPMILEQDVHLNDSLFFAAQSSFSIMTRVFNYLCKLDDTYDFTRINSQSDDILLYLLRSNGFDAIDKINYFLTIKQAILPKNYPYFFLLVGFTQKMSLLNEANKEKENFNPIDIRKFSKEVIIKLLARNISLKITVQNRNILHYAVANRNTDFLTELLPFCSADIINHRTNIQIFTPFAFFCRHISTRHRNNKDVIDILHLFADNGADLDINLQGRGTPFLEVILNLSYCDLKDRVISFFIKKGVDVFTERVFRLNYFQLCISKALASSVSLILKKDGVDINKRLSSTNLLLKPLEAAVQNYVREVCLVQALVLEADITTRNLKLYNLKKIIQNILEAKPRPATYQALFRFAFTNGRDNALDILDMILQYAKQDLNQPPRNKLPLIYYCTSRTKDISVVKYLISQNADISFQYKPAVCLLEPEIHRTINFDTLMDYRVHFLLAPDDYHFHCHICMNKIENSSKVLTCSEGEKICDCRICGNCFYLSKTKNSEKRDVYVLEDFIQRNSCINILNYYKKVRTGNEVYRNLREKHLHEYNELLQSAGITSLKLLSMISRSNLECLGLSHHDAKLVSSTFE